MKKNYLTGANGAAEAVRRGRGTLLAAKESPRIAALIESARRHGVEVRRVSVEELNRLTQGADHRGFALETDSGAGGGGSAGSALPGSGLAGSALAGAASLGDVCRCAGPESLVILLDGITDPHNLGAVLRCADQFAADAVIVPRRRSAGARADSLSRASSGAVEWVNLIETPNLDRALRELKEHGYWVWGADASGKPVHRADLRGKTALVIGREGQGLHRLTLQRCDGTVAVPAGGRLDSLNASVAAGIIMYETRRQQDFPYRSRE